MQKPAGAPGSAAQRVTHRGVPASLPQGKCPSLRHQPCRGRTGSHEAAIPLAHKLAPTPPALSVPASAMSMAPRGPTAAHLLRVSEDSSPDRPLGCGWGALLCAPANSGARSPGVALSETSVVAAPLPPRRPHASQPLTFCAVVRSACARDDRHQRCGPVARGRALIQGALAMTGVGGQEGDPSLASGAPPTPELHRGRARTGRTALRPS